MGGGPTKQVAGLAEGAEPHGIPITQEVAIVGRGLEKKDVRTPSVLDEAWGEGR